MSNSDSECSSDNTFHSPSSQSPKYQSFEETYDNMSELELIKKRKPAQNEVARLKTQINKLDGETTSESAIKNCEKRLSAAEEIFRGAHDDLLEFYDDNVEKAAERVNKKRIETAEEVYDAFINDCIELSEKLSSLRREHLQGESKEAKVSQSDQVLSSLNFLKGALKTIRVVVEGLGPDDEISQYKVETYLNDVSDLRKSACELRSKASCVLIGDVCSSFIGDISNFFVDLNNLEGELRELLKTESSMYSTPGKEETSFSAGTRPSLSLVKLPKLELPSFSGELLDWPSFSDRFTISIRNRQDLTSSQKLEYLKMAVDKGTAKDLIKGLSIQDSNYNIAWAQLETRYCNAREVIYSLYEKFVGQEKLKTDSVSELRKLIDVSRECKLALEAQQMSFKGSGGDGFLVYIVMKKMNSETRKQWGLTLATTEWPKYDELMKFLEQRANSLVVMEGPSAKASSSKSSDSKDKDKSKDKEKDKKKKKRKEVGVHYMSTDPCVLCNDTHWLGICPNFKKLAVKEKIKTLKENNCCHLCFSSKHKTPECKGEACRNCKNKSHHTWICFSKKKETKPQPEPKKEEKVEEKEKVDNVVESFNINSSDRVVLLETAVVKVPISENKMCLCRVFIDNGAQSDFVDEDVVLNIMKLTPKKCGNIVLTGMANQELGKSDKTVKLKLISTVDPTQHIWIEAIVMKNLMTRLPKREVKIQDWPHLRNLKLADPNYYKAQNVNIILGADTRGKIMSKNFIRAKNGAPAAQKSIFGWTLSGGVDGQDCESQNVVGSTFVSREVMVAHVHKSQKELLSDIKQLYELEEGPQESPQKVNFEEMEKFYLETTSRNEEGKFIVQLPFKVDATKLGNSRRRAEAEFYKLEKRFSKDLNTWQKYLDVFKEYEKCGYLEIVPDSELEITDENSYYVPHHPVFKDSSSTTKVRPVFNASAKTSSGVSLNDVLLNGPKLQDDLCPIVIRFRKHKIPIKGDIRHWYLRFLVFKNHRDFQRIVLRFCSDEPLKVYRFKVLVFGFGPASYLSQRSQKKLCHDEKDKSPWASLVIEWDMYMDDLLSGTDSSQDAVYLRDEIVRMLNSASLEMRKWASSDETFLSSIPVEDRELESFSLDNDVIIKTLGVVWYPQTDQFSFQVKDVPEGELWTKRKLLADNARMFDPMGWLSPVTIPSRIEMQLSWTYELGWDDPLPEDLVKRFLDNRKHLKMIEGIKINRWLFGDGYTEPQLCGFSDASKKAYAAVVYMRSQLPDGKVMVKLLYAKAKVAPLSSQSTNRLELQGALLLAEALRMTKTALKMGELPCHAWTDSSVVLDWLAKAPHTLETFVRNRVAKIQRILPVENWRHVRGDDNPADCASRGISAEEFIQHPLWWHGPSWLKDEDFLIDNTQVDLEYEVQTVSVNKVEVNSSTLDNVSTLSRLRRATANMYRFIRILYTRIEKKRVQNDPSLMIVEREPAIGPFSPNELERALMLWVKKIQLEDFYLEIEHLKNNKIVSEKSLLSGLSAYIDDTGIVRVGGRLNNSNLHPDSKNQIVLSANTKLAKLIVRDVHIKNLHSGFQATLASIRQKFWICRPAHLINKIIRSCGNCWRFCDNHENQKMAALPIYRVQRRHPFERCGIDYAGPINIKTIAGRKSVISKAYIVVFVCFVTRAIHLELVTNASTDNFLGALKRFVATRGYPSDLFSDRGTNFVGAKTELDKLLNFVKNEDHDGNFLHYLEEAGINWHFNPAGSPHFGGLWEAGVKSMKNHLKKVLMGTTLEYEVLNTLLKQIEASLNSRPMTALSSDPNDLSALTPGHFLVGRPLNAVPEPSYNHLKDNQLDNWQASQKIFEEFWGRWSMEYLPRLQKRDKWRQPRDEIQLGHLVRVVEENQPPLKWKLGRVTKLHPGKDGLVRAVSLAYPRSNYDDLKASGTPITKDNLIVKISEIQRPVVKCCILK